MLNSGHPPAPFCFCRTSSPRLFLENVYTTDISCTSFANWYLHCDNRSGAGFLSHQIIVQRARAEVATLRFLFRVRGGGGSFVECGTNSLTPGTTFLPHPFVCFVSSIFIVMRRCSIRNPSRKKSLVVSVVVFFSAKYANALLSLLLLFAFWDILFFAVRFFFFAFFSGGHSPLNVAFFAFFGFSPAEFLAFYALKRSL